MYVCEVCGKEATFRVVDKQEIIGDGATGRIHKLHLPARYYCDEHNREEKLFPLKRAEAAQE